MNKKNDTPKTTVIEDTPKTPPGRALAASRNDEDAEGVVSEGVVWARVKTGFVPCLVRIHGRTVVEEEALVREPVTFAEAADLMKVVLVRRVLPARVGGK